MNRTIRHAAYATLSLVAAITLAACGGGNGPGAGDHQNMPGMSGMPGPSSTSTTPSPSASGTAGHNAADVAFATGMIPHHQQAITMAEMAEKQATNAQVKTLAAAIKSAQDPEIQTMTGWLTAWGQPVPSESGHDMSNMGGSGMEGMMTDEEMQQLAAATGADFDRMWLQMMIKHHQGAVTMATRAASEGQSGEAKQLAAQIIRAQNAEIDAMQQLLPTIAG